MTDSEHTPSVEEIRAAYVYYSESADFPTQKHYLEWKAGGGAEGEFDRMLAGVARAAAEKAWYEGWDDRSYDFHAGYVPSRSQQDTLNPYRLEQNDD